MNEKKIKLFDPGAHKVTKLFIFSIVCCCFFYFYRSPFCFCRLILCNMTFFPPFSYIPICEMPKLICYVVAECIGVMKELSAKRGRRHRKAYGNYTERGREREWGDGGGGVSATRQRQHVHSDTNHISP